MTGAGIAEQGGGVSRTEEKGKEEREKLAGEPVRVRRIA